MVFAVSLPACEKIQNAIQTPGIAKVAPEPMTPVPLPTQTMKGGRGDADAAYPPDFGATVKPDGTILFPQRTTGRIQGSSIMVGNEAVLTVGPDGTLKGVALKHHYAFADDGALLDEDGHGVRILPEGGVRAVGGEWRYQAVFSWKPEGGDTWDKSAWRTLEIVALVIIENMLPAAIRSGDGGSASSSDGGKDKGFDIHIPPPSQWFSSENRRGARGRRLRGDRMRPGTDPTPTPTPIPIPTPTPTPIPTPIPTPTPTPTPPPVTVDNIGMHIGGGPNDALTKAPIAGSVAPHFGEFATCWTQVSDPHQGRRLRR